MKGYKGIVIDPQTKEIREATVEYGPHEMQQIRRLLDCSTLVGFPQGEGILLVDDDKGNFEENEAFYIEGCAFRGRAMYCGRAGSEYVDSPLSVEQLHERVSFDASEFRLWLELLMSTAGIDRTDLLDVGPIEGYAFAEMAAGVVVDNLCNESEEMGVMIRAEIEQRIANGQSLRAIITELGQTIAMASLEAVG